MKSTVLNIKLTSNQIGLFYLGQEGFIIKYNDKYLMIDGYLSNYVDKNCCSENVKWTRRYPAPISYNELDFIDYVFCTHAHYDHADPETLSALSRVNTKAKYIIPRAFADTVKAYGAVDIIYADADKEIALDADIKVMPVPAAHEQLNLDENGNYREMGFKITLGQTTVFHAGDCCVYDGLRERISGVNIAMLPINGRDYFRLSNDIIGNMDCGEAITLAHLIGAKLLIPMHFDLYDVNTVNPACFVDYLTKINPSQAFHIFKPGEMYIYAR